jgi:mono/diheme cytochrome c family protein
LPTETKSRAVLALAVLLAASGCRQNMHNQNKVRPFRQSTFYADGLSARPIPQGTVARGGPGEKIAPYTGLTVARQTLPSGPPPITMALLQRGQQRFNIYCSPCHDRTGSGQGMIVRRGFKQPTSYHTDRLRSVPIDYFYQVMTEGFGVMPSYAPQVPPEDRWAIAAYIRALQYSQNARLADLPAGRRPAVEKGLAGQPAPIVPAPGSEAGRGAPVHSVASPQHPSEEP